MIPPDNFVDLVEYRGRVNSSKVAFVFLEDGESVSSILTYEDLAFQAKVLAGQLQLMCRPGERVILLYPSCNEYIAAFFACLYAGLIAVPVFPPRGSKHNERLEAILRDCGAKVGLTTTQQRIDMQSAIKASEELKALTLLSSDVECIKKLPVWWRPSLITPDTVAFLQYTSGSTGQPKGVVVTHRNLISNSRMMQNAVDARSESTFVSWLPIYHDMGLIGNILQTAWLGTTCVLMAPVNFVHKPIRWLRAVSTYQADISGGPNFAFDLCAQKITEEQKRGLDLSQWRISYNGSEPVKPDTMERFAAAFAPYGFRRTSLAPCYGMAEATLMVSCARPQSEPVYEWVDRADLAQGRVTANAPFTPEAQPLAASGVSVADQTVRIVDPDTLSACTPGMVGEVWVAGDHVAKAYWDKPDASAATFQAFINGSGEGPFMRTGDLGYISNKQLFIVGRLKDIIVIRGQNYYPQDLETTVESIGPEINTAGVAAFGITSSETEQVVMVVEIDRGHLRKTDFKRLSGRIRQDVLEKHAVAVSDVVLVRPGTVPKTSSGKIQHRACRDRYHAGDLARIDTEVPAVAEAV